TGGVGRRRLRETGSGNAHGAESPFDPSVEVAGAEVAGTDIHLRRRTASHRGWVSASRLDFTSMHGVHQISVGVLVEASGKYRRHSGLSGIGFAGKSTMALVDPS